MSAPLRAGMLICACDGAAAPPANDNARRPAGRFALTAGFAFAVLAQTIAATVLPLAGTLLAPEGALVTWPFAALMLGAALASFPASFLRDAFGRRAGFALGASLGIAGGALLALGLLNRQFAFACIGGLWLGMAQGFSFFYRHEAAATSGAPGAAAAGVLAGGVLAALAGPALVQAAEALVAPYFLVGAAALAALAHVASLGVAVRLAPDPVSEAAAQPGGSLRPLLWPTAAGALAWFAMSALMAGSPAKLVACGVGEGAVFGFVALHVLAMYGPAVPLMWIAGRVPGPVLALAGGSLCAAALALGAATQTGPGLGAALLLSGAGWCIATVGTTAWLREAGASGRLALALHDGVLFCAALAGAQAAGLV
ncbi:hypothetical protein [Aquabacter spiritensis]|uniref:MFS transporter n=1 Tax=Aquabacter spiritensis TaxID=933073 RepID=A0A4R3M4M7_9HYPH|nr:hypothetical protein [Aquabacter spiritensis]TCT06135.1 hypothetical protein EDC64_103239 [Aquabacter spiritensis]